MGRVDVEKQYTVVEVFIKFTYEGFAAYNNGYTLFATSISGKSVVLNKIRPLHTALVGAACNGSRDDFMYTATLLSEANWTAESDKVFIPFTQSAGRYINDK